MKISLVKILIQLFIIVLLSSPTLAASYKVTRVYDGDTVLCVQDGVQIKVRLVGIDAPEISHNKREAGQPYSQQSMKYLAGLVLNKTVEIKGYGNDQYNRVLGELFIDNKNINLEMIKTGLAEAYKGKAAKGFNTDSYIVSEAAAKKSSKGMWTLGNKYISPSDWRKMQKED
jgi:micrococcal nuclease